MLQHELLERTPVTMLVFNVIVITISVCLLSEPSFSQTVYPDGGRNVIPVIRNKPSRAQSYNDATVMAHVIGSAGMNFLYYFHLLGVSCENADPEFYKIIQNDFEFCMNKTGSIPNELRSQPLGSIPKPCVDWKIRRPCYKNLADDYDECLMNKPGLVKKGTDALRFTHAYAKFICGNIADTEAHLLDRYTKHDLIVDGVFQCFPHLQDRIVNCVKRDKVSKTLCSKFYVVHACFGKYYNDDNCHDVQPIYYMDDLFRNMSASLSCPKDDNEWINRDPNPTHPPGEGGQYPTNPGWTHEPSSATSPPPRKGWTSREEHSVKENPWPGERGRPWSNNDRDPFIRGDHRQPSTMPPHSHNNHQHHSHNNKGWGWDSTERDERYNKRVRTTSDTHANRPHPDSWNSQQWVKVLFRDNSDIAIGSPLERGRDRNEIDMTRRGYLDDDSGFSTTRVPARGSYQYVPSNIISRTPDIEDGERSEQEYKTLPPAGIAVTTRPQDSSENGDEAKFYSTRASVTLGSTASNHDLGYNFYSFE